MYDVAVIGTGPAGLSAVLNLKINNKNFIWFGSRVLSDKVERAEQILNYPAIPNISGEELNSAFKAHIDSMQIEINERMVTSIVDMGKYFAVMAADAFYEARAVILATGVAPSATIKGEKEFLGRGVSYCATCDGNLYRGKRIAVISNNKRFEHEVKFLSELAEKVYFFPHYKLSADISNNTEVVRSKIEAIEGGMRANALRLGGDKVLDIDGVFCLRDSISLSALLPGLETDNGHIKVDRKMATNISGCFAAGDCTGRPYQYAKAVGEGNVAAHCVIEYINSIEKEISDED